MTRFSLQSLILRLGHFLYDSCGRSSRYWQRSKLDTPADCFFGDGILFLLVEAFLGLDDVALTATCRLVSRHVSLYPLSLYLYTKWPGRRCFQLRLSSVKSWLSWADGQDDLMEPHGDSVRSKQVSLKSVLLPISCVIRTGHGQSCCKSVSDVDDDVCPNPVYTLIIKDGRSNIRLSHQFEYPFFWCKESSLPHLCLLSCVQTLSGMRFVQNWGFLENV